MNLDADQWNADWTKVLELARLEAGRRQGVQKYDPDQKRYEKGVAVDETSGAGGGRFAPKDATLGPGALGLFEKTQTMMTKGAVLSSGADVDPSRIGEIRSARDLEHATDAVLGVSMEEVQQRKADIEDRLNEQLTDRERRALEEFFGPLDKESSGAGVAVKQWALEAGDHNPEAVAIQQAVAKEFQLDAETSHLGAPAKSDSVVQGALQKIVKTMYADTQKQLADAGIKEVVVFRGVATDTAPKRVMWKIDEHTTQPASSFSTSPYISMLFARSPGGDAPGGMVLATRIPAKDVLSFSRTGFGSLHESELVVLGRGPRKYFQFQFPASERGKLSTGGMFRDGLENLFGMPDADTKWWKAHLRR